MDAPDWTYLPPPAENAEDRARSDFFPRLVRPTLQVLFRIYLRAAFRLRIEGRGNLPRHGPFVLVANHTSHADAPALMATVPMHRVNTTHPLAALDYFFQRRWRGPLVHLLVNALPVDRHAPAEQGLAAALRLLREGHAIILFPEGTRSPDGSLQPFKRGVGALACGQPWPVVPAWIEGAHHVLAKGSRQPRRGRLRVRVGRPVSFTDRPAQRSAWGDATAEVEAAVRALAPHGPDGGPPGPGAASQGPLD